MTSYDSDYKARVKAAVLKAILTESLEFSPASGRTARVKLHEALDATVEALALISARRTSQASDSLDSLAEARRLRDLVAAAQTRIAA